MKRPGLRSLGPLLGLVLFVGALALLRRELVRVDLGEVLREARAISPLGIGAALALTAASYALLTLYDVLALRHAGRSLPYRRTALVSFTAYVASHNLGFSGVGGTAVRYRLYTAWGLSAAEIAEVVAFCAITFWVGFCLVGGLVFVSVPIAFPPALHAAFASTRPLGFLFLLPVVAFLLWALVLRWPVVLRRWRIEPPAARLLLLQLPLVALDWLVSAAVVHALLPAGRLDFAHVLALFLAAQAVGMVSHVPGGLGVFESVFLYLSAPAYSAPELLGALLVYRALYYLLPLALAVLLLIATEASLRRHQLVALGQGLMPIGEALVPRALALATAFAGGVLLVTGTLPAGGSRIAWLRDVVPLPVLELSHFLASLVGAGLLLLARGLARRIDAAWWSSVLALGGGIVLALARGFDFEEASLLALLLLALLPFRRAFHRRASLLSMPLRAEWWWSLALVLGSSLWLGLLAYRHVDYSQELWWRFAYEGDAPRFLRASAGVLGLVALFACARLLRAVAPPQPLPRADELEAVRAILAEAEDTLGHLALLGDKSLLFDERRSAFVMYGVRGRSWIALGDPVGGEPETRRELVWRFRELAEHAGGQAAFYQVSDRHLGWYAETGCALLKLGEEARLDLAAFSLEGRAHKGLRSALNRGEREGLAFEVVPPEAVPALLAELRALSERWLAAKHAREKGFSLGTFEPAYLARGPLALVRRAGQPLAFANLLLGGRGQELSLDLMRHEPDAPGGLMDFLFANLFAWGRAQGYAWFNLGMAPLSGLEIRPSAPLWNRFATLVAQHGERFYNFRGLRAYKDKFEPQWRPRYLAAPRGFALPRVLLDVSALISAGRPE